MTTQKKCHVSCHDWTRHKKIISQEAILSLIKIYKFEEMNELRVSGLSFASIRGSGKLFLSIMPQSIPSRELLGWNCQQVVKAGWSADNYKKLKVPSSSSFTREISLAILFSFDGSHFVWIPRSVLINNPQKNQPSARSKRLHLHLEFT